jgi:hypothetical protein
MWYKSDSYSHEIIFKHPVALMYHLFHTIIYFRLQCNLLLSPFLLTTCFSRTGPSSDASNSLKLLHVQLLVSHVNAVSLGLKEMDLIKINKI